MDRKAKRRRERMERQRLARGSSPRTAPGGRQPSPLRHQLRPRLAAQGADAQVQAVEQAVAPLPPNLKPWAPGQSGNPKGYSRGRRLTDALEKYLTQKGLDDAIAAVWAREMLKGNHHYMKMGLQYLEGLPGRPEAAAEVDESVPAIDPAIAERILAAADPTTLPTFEDEA